MFMTLDSYMICFAVQSHLFNGEKDLHHYTKNLFLIS